MKNPCINCVSLFVKISEVIDEETGVLKKIKPFIYPIRGSAKLTHCSMRMKRR